MSFRRTVARTVEIEGVGLHSGKPVEMTVAPGCDGIAVQHGPYRVPAVPSQVSGTRRCTALGPVSTVEHLMSALAGAGVTDAEVTVSAPEIPGADGSAGAFAAALADCGTERVGRAATPRLSRTVEFRDGATYIRVAPGTGHWRCTYDLGERWPGAQTVCLRLPEEYASGVAPARTIVLEEEMAAARQLELGRGLDEDAVVVIGQHGYLRPVRFPDEPARHKLLDLVGDLYLSGVPVHALDVEAVRCGHAANVRVAAQIAEAARIP
ncbi:UDP-3-O-acyl-N-acetylglucosamine deacetylase [Streptomyces sp. ODS28]|uniref:UDP-3-O-acyl-N-acetylglucosamine deacetylase n=1 Tax=Streptomyces sp. ODS28 TaxID=3136688 RepID=UPI0031E5C6CF